MIRLGFPVKNRCILDFKINLSLKNTSKNTVNLHLVELAMLSNLSTLRYVYFAYVAEGNFCLFNIQNSSDILLSVRNWETEQNKINYVKVYISRDQS